MIIDVYVVYGKKTKESPAHEILGVFRYQAGAMLLAEGKHSAEIARRRAVWIAEEYYLLEGPVDVDQVKEQRDKELVSQAIKKLSTAEINALRKEFKK